MWLIITRDQTNIYVIPVAHKTLLIYFNLHFTEYYFTDDHPSGQMDGEGDRKGTC